MKPHPATLLAIMAAFILALGWIAVRKVDDSFRCGYVRGVQDTVNAINSAAPRPAVELGPMIAKLVERRCSGVTIPENTTGLSAIVEERT